MDPTAGDDPRRLAVDLRPQTFGSGSADHVRDPIVEPAWPGLRVIAAVDADGAVIFEDGTPVEGHELILHRLRDGAHVV